MPKRSNLFQEVVALVHKHMAGDATVVESAMLRHRLTGEDREVDVVVRSTIAGQEVVIGIEATAGGRPATVQWVEQQHAKHAQLPTNKLVLVAQGGFAATARQLAEAYGIVAISPEDLAAGDPTFDIVNNLKSVWAKLYSASSTSVIVRIDHPQLGQVVEITDPPAELNIYKAGGADLCPLKDLVDLALETHAAEYSRGADTKDQAHAASQSFSLTIDPFVVNVNDVPSTVYARWVAEDGSSALHAIMSLHIKGESTTAVHELRLNHKRLGEVSAAYADFQAAGKSAALIATAFAGEERVVVRVRDAPNGPVREQVLAPLTRRST